jgi:hypothetical protein
MGQMQQDFSLPCQVESQGQVHVDEEVEVDSEAQKATQRPWRNG